MHQSRCSSIAVSLVELLLFSSVITGKAVGQGVEPPQAVQKSEALALRTTTVNAALAQKDLFDCSTYTPDPTPILPPEQQIFRIISDIEITPDDGKEYLGAFWSPKGDAAVFVVGTSEAQPIQDNDTLLSATGESPRLIAVGKTRLMLYSLASGTWQEIASDGSVPTWSADGRSIYYLAGTELMKFEVNTKRVSHTGLSVPYTGVGLSSSWPFPDGRLLAPRQPHAPLEVLGGTAIPPILIGVGDGDVVKPPRRDRVVIGYGTATTDPVTVIYDLLNGRITPILRSCQYSAVWMVWSPTGSQLAYPVHADPPEVRIYDLRSGQTQVLVRLDTFTRLRGLSWSPDEKYLAFTQEVDRPEFSIWVISTDGFARQRLVERGLSPNWSPDGRHVLYARRDTGPLLHWYVLEIHPTV
jgi:WD40 repeat protein